MEKRLDWSAGLGHGPVAGAFNAALATGFASVVFNYTHPATQYVALGGVFLAVMAGGFSLRGKLQYTKGVVAAYRFICWIAAMVWALYMDRHWTPQLWVHGVEWLFGGGFFVALLGFAFERVETSKAGTQPAIGTAPVRMSDAARRAAKIKAQWLTLLEEVCNKPGVQIPAVEQWKAGDGYTVEMLLPPDGTTLADLKGFEENLAYAMNLGPGCGVEIVGSAGGRRTILARVTTASALMESQQMPKDLSVRSINDPLAIGVTSDRTVASINVRFASAVMVGQKDSGKSNQLSVLIAQMMRCDDVFICVIDVSGGGRVARPFLLPYIKGEVKRPPIDFVANTNEQALLMTKGLRNVINRRTKAYHEVIALAKDDKLPVSWEIPQIVLVVDEFGALSPEVKEEIKQIVDTGRGAAVSTICCALGAKESYIPRNLIIQSRERIGMRVSDESELQLLFDTTWKRGRINVDSMPTQGFGYFSTNNSPPARFKGYRIESDALAAAAKGTVHRRVDLDAASAEAWDAVTLPVAGQFGQRSTVTQAGVFTNRWHHALPEMFEGTPRLPGPVPQIPAPRPEVNGVAVLPAANISAMTETTAELPQVLREKRPDAKAKYYEWLRSGSEGLTATRIFEELQRDGYPTNRQTVVGWLAADLADDRVRPDRQGREVFYKWIGD